MPVLADEWKRLYLRSAWIRQMEESGTTFGEFWDTCGAEDRDLEFFRYTSYPGPLLEIVLDSLTPGSSVLEIGAGGGAYTIPLARVAGSVVAVEPSVGQTARLIERSRNERIENIRIIRQRWEDVDGDDIGEYDLVLAAYCFFMPDIGDALQKMIEATRGELILINLVDHGFEEILASVFGEYDPAPRGVHLYACLCEMGVQASVEIVNRETFIPYSILSGSFRRCRDFDRDTEDRLRAALASKGMLENIDGKLQARRTYRDAVVRWRRNGPGV